MKSRTLNIIINIGILIITTAICLTMVEIWLRLFYGYGYLDKPFMFQKFYQYDPEIGRVVSPNREGMYRTAEGDRYYYVKTNSDGFRGEEIQDRHTPKIAVLGDSFIFGYGVDQEYIFSTVLNELTDGRVINFGNSGTSVDQMYLLLKRYMNTFIFSDVIVYISPNDFGDLLDKRRYGIDSPYLIKNNGTYEFRYPQHPWSDRYTYSETLDKVICNTPPSKKILIKQFLKKFLITYVVRDRRLPPKIIHEQEYNKAFLTTFTYDEFKSNFQQQTELLSPYSKEQSAPQTSVKIEIMDWILRQFIELSRKNSFRFHVIYDRLSKVEEEYLQYNYCQEHSCISFHKYRDKFRQKYPDYNVLCPRNPHWNEIGHRLFAYVLYRNLFEQGENE
jgi:hypothetical protein